MTQKKDCLMLQSTSTLGSTCSSRRGTLACQHRPLRRGPSRRRQKRWNRRICSRKPRGHDVSTCSSSASIAGYRCARITKTSRLLGIIWWLPFPRSKRPRIIDPIAGRLWFPAILVSILSRQTTPLSTLAPIFPTYKHASIPQWLELRWIRVTGATSHYSLTNGAQSTLQCGSRFLHRTGKRRIGPRGENFLGRY